MKRKSTKFFMLCALVGANRVGDEYMDRERSETQRRSLHWGFGGVTSGYMDRERSETQRRSLPG